MVNIGYRIDIGLFEKALNLDAGKTASPKGCDMASHALTEI
jgi:hypothetical protein